MQYYPLCLQGVHLALVDERKIVTVSFLDTDMMYLIANQLQV